MKPAQHLYAIPVFFACLCGCRPAPAPPPPPPANYLPPPGADTGTLLTIGDRFPQLTAVDLDGNDVVLGPELLGESATLIIFWSTWCGHCMNELPHEIALSRQYAESGLRVIGINADDSPEIAREAVRELEIPWLNVFEGPEATVSDQLGITIWPALYLLDSEGTIISATPFLRGTGVESLPDGTTWEVNVLDWTLEATLKSDD